MNSAVDEVARDRVRAVVSAWTDTQLKNASWNTFADTVADKSADGLLAKSEEVAANKLLDQIASLDPTDPESQPARYARGQLRIYCRRTIHFNRQRHPSLQL
jgi:hypothetical protein